MTSKFPGIIYDIEKSENNVIPLNIMEKGSNERPVRNIDIQKAIKLIKGKDIFNSTKNFFHRGENEIFTPTVKLLKTFLIYAHCAISHNFKKHRERY